MDRLEEQVVKDLVMIVTRLSRKLKRLNPEDELPKLAIAYLVNNRL